MYLHILLPLFASSSLAQAHYVPSKANEKEPYSIEMAKFIISQHRGILESTADRSSLLQAGFTQKAFSQLNQQYPSQTFITAYIRESVNSVIHTISNASLDTTFPLDRLSNGNGLIHAYEQTQNATYSTAYEALRQSVDLQPRNAEGSLWYYVYPNYTYLDGMYSLAPFLTLYANTSNTTTDSTFDLVLAQLNYTYQHTHQPNGLLTHGYDASQRASWADPVTGASPFVWGRALGWYTMALTDTFELLPAGALEARSWIEDHFATLMQNVVAYADGAWWQVVDQPRRKGNYIESSSSAMFVYSLLKGQRIGLLEGKKYVRVAKEAYEILQQSFVVRDDEGMVVGWNGTVGVCSLNSTATYEYYTTQPLSYNSVLGSAAFVLASLEYERL